MNASDLDFETCYGVAWLFNDTLSTVLLAKGQMIPRMVMNYSKCLFIRKPIYHNQLIHLKYIS